MGRRQEIRCFDYVNHPYDRVKDVMSRDALAVFQAATRAASSRAHAVASALRVDVGPIGIGTDIAISVNELEERRADVTSRPVTRLALEWKATRAPGLFPFMKAELSIYPLTGTETQLDFLGRYDPPLGALGGAVDALVGHRIADASVHRFVGDVASYLRKSLG
jgi:hypothetical protein